MKHITDKIYATRKCRHTQNTTYFAKTHRNTNIHMKHVGTLACGRRGMGLEIETRENPF